MKFPKAKKITKRTIDLVHLAATSVWLGGSIVLFVLSLDGGASLGLTSADTQLTIEAFRRKFIGPCIPLLMATAVLYGISTPWGFAKHGWLVAKWVLAVAVIVSFAILPYSTASILATGGYDANPEMMQAWTRVEDYAYSSWWNPAWGTTGDGHMMGLAIGAQMDPIPHPVMNFRWGTPDSFTDFRTWAAISLGILVNGRGKRFVREDAPFQAVSNAQNAQPGYGKNCWYIFDEGMITGMEDAIDEFKQKGWLFEGASVEELANAAGIDAEGLKAELDRYMAFCTAGKDEDFGRDVKMTAPFTGGRLFAFTTNSNVLATVGGLCIDENCSVLDVNDNPIKGLFACGNASGSFFSGNYPRHIPGTSIGRAVTFGYVAAESAVNGTLGKGAKIDGNIPELAVYGEGDPVTDDQRKSFESMGVWDPYNPIHGSSLDYTPEQLGGIPNACDNCHEYAQGKPTVGDSMTWKADK